MIHVGALTWLIYLERQKGFPRFVYCNEKYSQLKLMNILNNSENFLTNFWYLNTSLLVSSSFIPEC
jgi:hypothetical protein